MEWNKEKLTNRSNLSIKDIGALFAPEFIVIENERKYNANHENYYEFLNQFRLNIVSLDYNVQEYISTESTVVMPLIAKVKRVDGKVDLFNAIVEWQFFQ